MKLDIIYTYYNGYGSGNTGNLLEKYLYHWSNNFSDTKHDINFVIVDDHSTKKAIDIVSNFDVRCNLQVYYVEDNIIWNESGARNLGVKESSSDLMLLMDWDCIVYEDLIKEILSTKFNDNTFYQFFTHQEPRFNFKRNTIRYYRHESVLCLTRKLWEISGGFDEDFAGRYGYVDTAFTTNLINTGIKRKVLNKVFLLQNSAEGRSVDENGVRVERWPDNCPKKEKSYNYGLWQQKRQAPYIPKNSIRFKYIKQYENLL